MSVTPAGRAAAASPAARRDLMTVLLAVAGGGVDAVIFLGFSVFTAAQTGNTVVLAISLARGQFATGVRSVVSIVGYVAGAAVGELVLLRWLPARRRASASRLTAVGWTLVAELAALGALLAAWLMAGTDPAPGTSAVLIALAALAMGIQSAAVLRLHTGPTTTYVTGTLTTFTTELMRWLPRGAGDSSSAGPWLYGATWLLYAGGALASGLAFERVGPVSLALPIAAIIAVVVGARRPAGSPVGPDVAHVRPFYG